MKRKQGFTLIEVLVAVTIVAVLTAAGVISYSSVNKRSRDAKRKSDIEQLRSALEMYRTDYSYYPKVNTVNFNNVSNLDPLLVSDYLPGIPTDPQVSGTVFYRYKATDPSGGQYYGYCLCAKLETLSANDSNCADTLPAACNYGIRHP